MMLAPVLTPHGLLTLMLSTGAEQEARALERECGIRLEKAFARGCGHGLLSLGADEVGTTLPPTLSYWQKFAAGYVTALCSLPRHRRTKQASRADPGERRTGDDGRSRPAHDRRGILVRRFSTNYGGSRTRPSTASWRNPGSRCRNSSRAVIRPESSGACSFQPRGEPQG